MTETIVGPDGKLRCRWSDAAPEFLTYHDTEWGFPVDDDPQTVSTSADVCRIVKRTEKAGLEVRGAHHSLRLYASNGSDKRPCGGLRNPGQSRVRTQGLQTTGALSSSRGQHLRNPHMIYIQIPFNH